MFKKFQNIQSEIGINKQFFHVSKAGVQDFWIGAWNGPGGSGWLQWSDGSSVQYDQLPLDQERYHQKTQLLLPYKSH